MRGSSPSPFYGSVNKPLYFGDEKNLVQKRGVDLLQTEEDDFEVFNSQPSKAQQYIALQNQTASILNNNKDPSPIGFGGQSYGIENFRMAPKIIKTNEKSRQFKASTSNQFHGITANKMAPIQFEEGDRIISNQNNQNLGPNISVINYNNPTINMNFNEPQFNQQPVDQNAYDDQDFYEQLNYAKMNSTAANAQKKKNQPQNPSQNNNNVYNSTFTSPFKQGNQTVGPLTSKLQAFASATMNQQATAIMKTVPLSTNPYTDDLSKTTKNMNQPMSQQVSRNNSISELDPATSDIEEIGTDVKKKVVKKKIIKKIIKKRNPDGTLAPAHVTTIIVQKDGNKKPDPNQTFNIEEVKVDVGQQSIPQPQQITPTIPFYPTQDQIQKQNQTMQPEETKKKKKIIIIKKKKKAGDPNQTMVEAPSEVVSPIKPQQQQQQTVQQQVQQPVQVISQQEVLTLKATQIIRLPKDQQPSQRKQPQLNIQQQNSTQQQPQQSQAIPQKEQQPKKKPKKPVKQDTEEDEEDNKSDDDEDDEEDAYQKQKQKKKMAQKNKSRNKRKQLETSNYDDDEDDDSSSLMEESSVEIINQPKKKYKKKQQQQQKKPSRRRETTEDQDVSQSMIDSDQDSDEYQSRRKQVQKRRRKRNDEDDDDDDEEETKKPKRDQVSKRSQSVIGGYTRKQNEQAKKQPIKQRRQTTETESDDEISSDNDEDEESEDEEDDDDEEDRNDAENSDEGGSRTKRIRNFQRQQQRLQMQQELLNREKQKLEQQRPLIMQQSSKQNQPIIQKPLSFKVAICDPESYKAFVDQLVYGSRTRELIMNPIPFQMGQLRFTIERHRSGLSRLHPSYYFYLEKNQGGRLQLLYAKKRAFNKTANYLISMEKNKKTRNNDVCLGKLRANPEGDKYVLYDNGENFTKVHQFPLEKIRNEHGIYQYRYEPCNVGNIRKMIIILPVLVQTNLTNQQVVDNTLPLGQPTCMEPKQILLSNIIETNTYVYDFKGRVTQPSIKNFQLIPELDGRRQVTLQDFVLQFEVFIKMKCELCQTRNAKIKRPKNQMPVCQECFFLVFEEEIHHTIISNNLFKRGEKIAIGASGGKDSTVLAHVLTTLNKRHDYGLDLELLSVDEGIIGYRDDSLETVKKNQQTYQVPLTIVSYKDLYGWTMDEIVKVIGLTNNCTFCGVFRRQALDRGAMLIKADKIVTGHNADDIAETVYMNILRGDFFRLHKCVDIMTGREDALPRCKPFKYTYEKEIVMYAYHKKLDYFSTECIYSPNAYRGYVRELIKDLEKIRPSIIIDIIHSGESIKIDTSKNVQFPKKMNCIKCGFVSSNDICKACVLLEGLNKDQQQPDGQDQNNEQQPSLQEDQKQDNLASLSIKEPSQMPSSLQPGGVIGQSLQQNELHMVGEEGVNLEEKKDVIPPEVLEDMQNIWSVFDLERKDQVSVMELRTILRALDLDLGEEELEFLHKQIDPEQTGFFTFAKLREIMEEKLKDVDTMEDLLEQLKKLDRDKDGKIPNPEFKQFLMNLGSKMNLEQVEDLMKEADPKGDGTVDIEELATRLCPPKK